MEQRDYLQKQIDLLGKVLGKLFASLSGYKTREVSNSLEIVSQTLKNELDFDLEDFLRLQPDKFVHSLKTEKNFTHENMAKLADILLILADQSENKKQAEIYKKCLALYEYIDQSEETYSHGRHLKIEKIRNLIS